MMSGKKIIEGLEQAIAFTKGDETAGRIVRGPTPEAVTAREVIADAIHVWLETGAVDVEDREEAAAIIAALTTAGFVIVPQSVPVLIPEMVALLRELQDELVRRLDEDACNAGACYANASTDGLHLLRWQEDMAEAAARITALTQWNKELAAVANAALAERDALRSENAALQADRSHWQDRYEKDCDEYQALRCDLLKAREALEIIGYAFWSDNEPPPLDRVENLQAIALAALHTMEEKT